MTTIHQAARLACSLLCLASVAFADHLVKGSIEKTVDGDTIWVQATNAPSNGPRERLKIRMVGIDAPESHLPTSEGVMSQGQYGELASQAMASLAPVGTRVTVVDKGLDKYERTLGRVMINEKDINLQMVEIGWAIPYIICEGPACNESFLETEKAPAYFEACDSARTSGLGIFDPKKPLKEMPFEFRLRMQKRKADKYVGNFETGELYRPADYNAVDVCSRVFFKRIIDAKRAGFTPVFRVEPGEQ